MAASKRLTVRVVGRDAYARVDQIIEQEIPATTHDVALFLRRDPCRRLVAGALLEGGTATLEVKRER
jgi:hypothetical protein